MPKSLKELNTTLLGSVFRNIQTCKRAINNVIEKISDSSMKRELKRQFKDYDSLSEECEDLSKIYDVTLVDNNFFTKAKMWINVNLATFLDKSNRKIASITILGSTMGIIDLMGTLSDSRRCKKELINFTKKVLELEQTNVDKLKPYILQSNYSEEKQVKKSGQNKNHNQSKKSPDKENEVINQINLETKNEE